MTTSAPVVKVHDIPSLHENYIVPVYVLNPTQLADVVLREVLRQGFKR